LFIEAPIWNEVYFFTELNLAEPELADLNLRVGELYLDFENISQLWGGDRMLNARVGRFYIPFGEEYLNRFAIDNPLVSRSLTDIWAATRARNSTGPSTGCNMSWPCRTAGVNIPRFYPGQVRCRTRQL